MSDHLVSINTMLSFCCFDPDTYNFFVSLLTTTIIDKLIEFLCMDIRVFFPEIRCKLFYQFEIHSNEHEVCFLQ